jgi:hypothetical protein
MRSFSRTTSLAAAACVALAAWPAAAATGRTLAGVSCETPPPVHCAIDGCTREQLGNPGNAKEPKSGRSFFLDYPCDLKPGEKVVFLLSLHGAGSIGNWQRHYFPALDYKDKYRLVIATPTAATTGSITPGAPGVRMWNADADDAFLRDLVDYVVAEVGRPSIKAFWLVGHSQGGMTSNRIVCTDYFKDKVDGWLSLSGGRIGPAAIAPDFFGPSGPPASLASGSGPRPGVAAMPACDISFIFTSGEKEITGLPAASPWAEKHGCGARGRQKDIVDTAKGYVTGAAPGRGASWGREARPGTSEVFVYPKCKGKKVVADVLRIDKGHTEGLEPKVTESLVAMMASAPGGKIGVANAAAPSAKDDDLAARIQRIEDRQAIEQLMVGDYPRALDSANWKAYASFFATDGELIVNGTSIKGPAAIEAYFNRPRPARAGAPANPEPRVGKHVVTNLTIQITGDRAVAQGYWQTVMSRASSTTIAGAGHYEDVLKKENGTWKFLRRAILTEPPSAPPAAAPSTR